MGDRTGAAGSIARGGRAKRFRARYGGDAMTRSTTSALGAMRRFVAALVKVQTEAANCIARMECGEPDRRPSRHAKPRKPRWSGPVAPEVRAAREQAFIKRFTLSMEQGKDATKKIYAITHSQD